MLRASIQLLRKIPRRLSVARAFPCAGAIASFASVASIAVIVFAAFSALTASAASDQRNLIPEVRHPQDSINAGIVPFHTLFLSGKHIFSNRFTPEDHFGEAPNGPRRALQALANRPNVPMIRFNGLDAQSCLECHQFNGMFTPNASLAPMQFPRELGATGGGAGFSANIFAFSEWPNNTIGPVRSPPHLFGLGYVQRLGEEMSETLMTLRDGAKLLAAQQGQPYQVTLVAKGIHFGTLTAKPDGTIDEGATQLEGVSKDLVVRPFQFKGNASTIRNFVASAMNFHFSVQPKELIDRNVIPNDNPTGALVGDPLNEIFEGEISAVTAYIAFNRPPVEDATGLDAGSVARGRQRFNDAACATCHRATLPIADPRVTVIDPRILLPRMAQRAANGEPEPPTPARPTIIDGEKSSEDLSTVRQFELFGQFDAKPIVETGDDPSNPIDRLPGYTRNLNRADGPADTLARLPFHPDGAIDVPLYSDLKRHKMGADLAETFTQQTDVTNLTVPTDEFLTRPLWGMADTGPWMHDGRALTLADSILMHGGAGSEANNSVAAFNALNAGQKEDLLNFLRSLRVPLPPLETQTDAYKYWLRY